MKILERNAEGVTTIQDGTGVVTLTFPQGYSAIYLLSCEKNNWQDREVIVDDGYVYDEAGNRKRKWFSDLRISPHKPFYYWHPKLDNISYCEAKYHKMSIKMDEFYKNNKVFRQTIAAQPFYCFYVYSSYKKDYVVFDGKPTDEGLGWDWAVEKHLKKYPLKQEIGDAYFAYRKEADRWARRKWCFEKLFLKSLDKNLYSKLTGTIEYLKLSVNGREYLVARDQSHESYGVKIICNQQNTLSVDF